MTDSPQAERTNADRWRRVRALFEDAIDRDPGEWPRLLEMAADDERELLAQMLAADRSSEPLLDRTPDQLAAALLHDSEPVPDRIDRYRIIRAIGRGGMGQVLLARRDDGTYDQQVAIKVVRRGMDSEDVLRRFRVERQILAELTHANIATLLDGGITTDGRPYFVMEFVPGMPITTYCATHQLPLAARLELFATTCAAVQYAHAHGIIHRDLKPRNIIVAEGPAPASGTVKLLDFGIARLLDADTLDLTLAHTNTGSRLMTPDYASPEQFRGDRVGAESDVYSLGVVLHELVTGRRPHHLHGVPPGEAERVVCEQPVTLRALEDSHVPAALRSIILKSLRKEPERRYATAGELGADLRRFVAGEAVHARGDSIPYRVGSFVRRRSVSLALGVAALAVMGAVLVAGVAVATLAGRGTPAAVATAAATSPISIAVLPFESTGDTDESDIFADGIHEDVVAHLSKVSGLRVIARTSVIRFRDSDAPLGAIGEELRVQAVVQGSVWRIGDRVRVTAHLIDVVSGVQLWGESYDRDIGDTFTVQADIASRITDALEVVLTPDDHVRMGSSEPTVDREARQHYLRGRHYWGRRDGPSIRMAMEAFEAALAIQPDYAMAHAGLADAHALLPFYGAEPAAPSFARARAAAERALALDPSLAEPHATLGLIRRTQELDWSGAERSFRRAIELQPNYATAYQWLGQILSLQGRTEEAAAALATAMDLDPLSSTIVGAAADAAFYAGRFDEALQHATFVRDLGGTPGVGRMGRIHLAIHDTASAVQWAEQAAEVNVPLGLAYAGYIFANVGRTAEAEALLERLRDREADLNMPAATKAIVLVGLGRFDSALDALEASLTARDPWFSFAILDPAFRALNGNPRWSVLRARAGLL
jgi:eukaryotic-like serine/threonine-protein kinase